MTRIELRNEIQKVLEGVSEDVLQDVLHLLKGLQGEQADKLVLSDNLRRILSEDKELLEKLAK